MNKKVERNYLEINLLEDFRDSGQFSNDYKTIDRFDFNNIDYVELGMIRYLAEDRLWVEKVKKR